MIAKRKRFKTKNGSWLTPAQEEHLVEGYSLEEKYPFESIQERETLYRKHKDYLFERTKDPSRIHDHFYYKADRELPQAYFDYETERGQKKYANRIPYFELELKWRSSRVPG